MLSHTCAQVRHHFTSCRTCGVNVDVRSAGLQQSTCFCVQVKRREIYRITNDALICRSAHGSVCERVPPWSRDEDAHVRLGARGAGRPARHPLHEAHRPLLLQEVHRSLRHSRRWCVSTRQTGCTSDVELQFGYSLAD